MSTKKHYNDVLEWLKSNQLAELFLAPLVYPASDHMVQSIGTGIGFGWIVHHTV